MLFRALVLDDEMRSRDNVEILIVVSDDEVMRPRQLLQRLFVYSLSIRMEWMSSTHLATRISQLPHGFATLSGVFCMVALGERSMRPSEVMQWSILNSCGLSLASNAQ
jgi:hypothetical protein